MKNLIRSCLLPALLILISLSEGDTRAAATATPIGLSLFFQDGSMDSLLLVDDVPRYVQEIEIIATVCLLRIQTHRGADRQNDD
jgi:hypothetical protein